MIAPKDTNNFPDPVYDEEITPNTTGVIETLESGKIEEIETILGPAFRLPRAGIIRPGIKVLKTGCTAQDRRLYDELVKQGLDWDEIDQRLGKDLAGKTKLIPQNVDYFTIRAEDCQNPQNTEAIHRLYADRDGKLRSFPVWFATNDWWDIIPHSLRCFGKQQGLRFVSFFKGHERWCKFPAPTTPKQKIFGGRVWGERPCEPNTCMEFQSGECKFGGVIQCYIPGTKGIGIWIIPTVSWRSLISIKSSLEAFSKLTGGRISGLFDLPDKDSKITPQAIFRISKKKETVYPESSNGETRKQQQWIINLDIDFDLSEVVKWAAEQKVISRGHKAMQTINGSSKNSPKIELETSKVTQEATQEVKQLLNELKTHNIVAEPISEEVEVEVETAPSMQTPTPQQTQGLALDAYQKLAKMLEDSESPTELETNYFLIERFDSYQLLSNEAKNKLKAYADSLKSKFSTQQAVAVKEKEVETQPPQQTQKPQPATDDMYNQYITKLEGSDSILKLQENYLKIKDSEEFRKLSQDQQTKIKVYTTNLKKKLDTVVKEKQPF